MDTNAISQQVVDYLKANAPGIFEKDFTAGDVHQPTALGNDKKKRPISTPDGDEPDDDGDESAEKAWSIPFKIAKQDPDQKMIFGWASVSEIDGKLVIDKQGDIIEPEELEKAAYEFVLYSRQHGDMHVRKGTGRLIESMVFTKEKQEALGVDIGMVGWWAGWKIDDDGLWKDIRDGKRPELSIGGRAMRVPV